MGIEFCGCQTPSQNMQFENDLSDKQNYRYESPIIEIKTKSSPEMNGISHAKFEKNLQLIIKVIFAFYQGRKKRLKEDYDFENKYKYQSKYNYQEEIQEEDNEDDPSKQSVAPAQEEEESEEYMQIQSFVFNENNITKLKRSNTSSLNNILPSIRNGVKYIGYRLSGKMEGFGKLEWNNKYYQGIVIGNFSEDHNEGISRWRGGNGIQYDGEFKKSKANGFGIYRTTAGRYLGEWRNDTKTNYGIETLKSGGKYIGEYVNGNMNGYGIYKEKSGEIYYGEMKENACNGFGILSYKDERIYMGEWKDNEKHGYGEMSWANGQFYLGFWKNNQKKGFGILFSKEKNKVHIGFWKANIMHGIGKGISKKGVKYGQWTNGELEITFDEKSFVDILNKSYPSYKKYFKANYDSLDAYISKLMEDDFEIDFDQ